MAAMYFDFLQLLVPIGNLVILVAKWTGVIFLRRCAGKLTWGLMLAGVILTSLTSITSALGLNGMSLFGSHMGYQLWRLGSQFGNVAFAVGFVLYAMKAAKDVHRQGELEQLATAMSEEIDRLKENCRP
jgi:hypothetical protein